MSFIAYLEDRSLVGPFATRAEAVAAHPGAQAVLEVQPRRVPPVERCEACGRPIVPSSVSDVTPTISTT